MHREISVYSVSLGCPKNLVDTERLLGALGPSYRPARSPEEAELILVNTCSFLESAVEESVETILTLVSETEDMARRPFIVVTGCLVARYTIAELQQELPEVDLWLGLEEQSGWKHRLAEHVHGLLAGRAGALQPGRTEAQAVPRVLSTPPGTAYLKVSEGCNHSCAFCLIPSIRGPLRTAPASALLAEARELLARGVQELVLVGQDVASYGRDRGGRRELHRLLQSLAGLAGLTWLRLMYLYPSGLTTELLSVLRDISPPLLPYFDVPLQHAHPEILSSMGRPFAGDPRRVIDRIRSTFPQASLRTSLIVGYPGETEAHYRALRDFVKEAGMQHVGVFAFSPEEATPAAEAPDQVEEEVKEERRQELMELQAGISRDLLAGYRGRSLDVLVDRPHPEWPTLYEGRSWFQAPEVDGLTYISGSRLVPGRMVRATVEQTWDYDLSTLSEAG